MANSPPLDTSDPQRCGVLHENGTVASAPVVGKNRGAIHFQKVVGEFQGWLVGGWTNPFEKYACQNGNLPQIGVKIKNIWNHQPDGFGVFCSQIGAGTLPVVLFFFPDWCFLFQGSAVAFPKTASSKMKVPEVLIVFAASEKKAYHRLSYNWDGPKGENSTPASRGLFTPVTHL